MSQHRDPCIFCNEDKPLTRQHVWPKWLEKIFPHPKNSVTNFRQTLEAVVGPNEIEISPKTKSRQGYMLSIKYRKVCAHCNNVWLSGIEEAVKPAVEKLISGTSTEISSNDLDLLAIWISIVAYMAEFTHPENMGIPRNAGNQIFRDQSPLPFCRIYIGQYLGSEYSPFRYRHRAAVLMSPAEFHGRTTRPTSNNCQTSVFVLGELLVVVDSADEAHYTDFVSERGGAGSPLVQIYPPPSGTVIWPPAMPIGDALLDFIYNGRFLSFGEIPPNIT